MMDILLSGAKDLLGYLVKRKDKQDKNQEINRIIRERNRLAKESKAKDDTINKQKIEIAKLKQKLKYPTNNSDESSKLKIIRHSNKVNVKKLSRPHSKRFVKTKRKINKLTTSNTSEDKENNEIIQNNTDNISPAKSLKGKK